MQQTGVFHKNARFRPKITLAETKADWHHPTHIRFGPGKIKELPGVCWLLGMSAPLIVTDYRVSKLAFVKSIIRRNKEESIFTGGPGHAVIHKTLIPIIAVPNTTLTPL